MTKVLPALDKRFRLEEATIGELHAAIKAEATTCVAVVQTYIARVRAYNGVASALATAEGPPVAPGTGPGRAGGPGDRHGARRQGVALPDRDGQGFHDPARPRQIHRAAARIRAHGGDR